MSQSQSQSGSSTTEGPLDRVVHARFPGVAEVVRYDRQGRWYKEHGGGRRERLRTVHDAVAEALTLEARGGVIYEGRPGGNRFDYMVASGRRKQAGER